jgi:RNA polymerase sigma factor (TIGR02999 family)
LQEVVALHCSAESNTVVNLNPNLRTEHYTQGALVQKEKRLVAQALATSWSDSALPPTGTIPWTSGESRENFRYHLATMSDLTHILSQIETGDPSATEKLLPLVYDELRKLAASKLANESSSQTLQATALVHEAYLRLMGGATTSNWDSRGHFFAAAAEAMRRILVESARRKKRLKHGGGNVRQELGEMEIAAPEPREDLLALDAALDKSAAELVQLRYFAGLTLPEAAQAMNIAPRSADRLWAYARAWLHQELQSSESFG